MLRQIALFKDFADIVSCGYGDAPDGVVEHVGIPERFDRHPWRSDRKRLAVLLGARRHERLYFGSEKIRFLCDAIPVESVDVVVANDVLAVPLAIALSPRMGVHADLHEYAPRQGEDSRRWRLLTAPFMDWACRKYVTRANSVSTVAKGIAEEYASVYRIAEPSVVPNASPYAPELSPTPVGDPLRITHIGVAGRSRRLEVMIDAVAQANELKPGAVVFDLVLAPGDRTYIEELTRKAASVPNGAVRVLPPVEFDQIVAQLHRYDIGFYLCPPINFNMLNALPNKLFEFVQARLAVVIGPSPEMRRVAEEFGFGIVSTSFEAQSAAKLLAGLTLEQVGDLKKAAHEAAPRLSADAVSGPWIDAVRKLAGVS